MGWPCVAHFTSFETRDWAEAGLWKSNTAAPKSRKKMSWADKARVVAMLSFMKRPISCFVEISPRLVTGGKRERAVCCLAIPSRMEAPHPLKEFAQALAGLVQLRLRITNGTSKNLGDLAVFVTLDVVENKYFPVALRQLIDCRLEVDPVKQATEPRIWPADFLAGLGVLFFASADVVE